MSTQSPLSVCSASKPGYWTKLKLVMIGIMVSTILGCSGGKVDEKRNAATRGSTATGTGTAMDEPSASALAEGRRVFRFETFGDEAFWTDTARMHEVVRESVSPALALKVGLKVDAEAIPPDIAAAIKSGQVDLESPATTVALLKLNAVVGLKGTVETVDGKDQLVRLGITCALCHSTVDNSFSAGIGRRLDGWPNRDLNVGAIIALSPAITPAQKAIYSSWGPGKYDPRFNLDGKSTPLVLPPAYGLANVTNETYTAEGPISYWNAYVAVTQMHGLGNFSEPRLGIDVKHSPDMVTPHLAALRDYQHSLKTPEPPAGTVDVTIASRGQVIFNNKCASCHTNGSGTDNNAGKLHMPAETGMDGQYALRTTNKQYRTTPLRGLWQHPPYFHDGSAKSLVDVVDHYDRVLELHLSEVQKLDLVEYLKSL
ncbi:MAG: c-type cytochrome [Candidatus Eisenbacteria bacterium]|nr:c-type cytochrome [Candidatus Eisenbacteria bacterium]